MEEKGKTHTRTTLTHCILAITQVGFANGECENIHLLHCTVNWSITGEARYHVLSRVARPQTGFYMVLRQSINKIW